MAAARTTRALLRSLLAGCLVLSLCAALTGQADAAWRPTGRGSVAAKAAVLPPPVAFVTPQQGRTCATSSSWVLRWTLGTYQEFTLRANGVRLLAKYLRSVGPKGNSLNEWYMSVFNNTNTMFTVSYSNRKWTATSAPVTCRDR